MKCGTASAALPVLVASYLRFPPVIGFIYRPNCQSRNIMTARPFDFGSGERPFGNVAAVASGFVQNSIPTTSPA